MSTWGALLGDALCEINVYSPSDIIPAADLALAARRSNRIIDQWGARRGFAYSQSFTPYTLTPGHSPHLLGPNLTSPDFATPNAATRPTVIRSASLRLTDATPNVDVPLNIRTRYWWQYQRIKTLSTNVPTDLYYEPDFPSGSCYFWPVPSYAYGVLLELLTQLAAIPLDGNGNPNYKAAFVAPQGYELALMLTLAEELTTAYEKPLSQQLKDMAARARAAVQKNNLVSPEIATADVGVNKRRRGDFNYYTGGPA